MADKDSPLLTVEPTEKGMLSLDRIKERFRVSNLPHGLTVLAGSESAINDVFMNLNRHLSDGALEERVKLLIAVGIASVAGSKAAVNFFSEIAIAAGRKQEEVLDAIGTASVCSIFNGYYRFRDQIPEEMVPTFEAFRAPFNANSFMKSALTPFEIEAVCIAVSSANDCHACVASHIKKAKALGMTMEQIDEVIKAAAVANATAKVLGAI